MGDSLDPTALTRLWHGLRPDWARTVAARRVAAGGLVALAAVLAFRADPGAGTAPVLVAARDLTPGTQLVAADFQLESRSATTIPDGAQTEANALEGKTLAGPTRRGEVITDVKVLGPRLAEAAAGPDARLVPLHLADPALLELLRPGDVVDVLAVDSQEGQSSRVVARGAIVVLANPAAKATASGAGIVLVALPAGQAVEAATTSLTQAVTLTFH